MYIVREDSNPLLMRQSYVTSFKMLGALAPKIRRKVFVVCSNVAHLNGLQMVVYLERDPGKLTVDTKIELPRSQPCLSLPLMAFFLERLQSLFKWPGISDTRRHQEESLPLNSAHNEDEYDVEDLVVEQIRHPPQQKRQRTRYVMIAFLILLFIIIALTIINIIRPRLSSHSPSTATPPTLSDPVKAAAHHKIDLLYARQSKSLLQARTHYTLMTDRDPPQGYDEFFAFAQKNECLIDDYEQIHRDLEPFYQLARDDPKYFRRMLDKARSLTEQYAIVMASVQIRNGTAHFRDEKSTMYSKDWKKIFERLHLPDMDLLINGQDEPRVVFNSRLNGAHERGAHPSDAQPFLNSPSPTADFFGPDGEKHCLLPNRKDGLGDLVNDDHAFLLSSSSQRFTTDLYPILSMAKIHPCFSDILVPSNWYYRESEFYPHYTHPDDIGWNDKKPVLYWRGSTTGGLIEGENYRHFQRFHFIKIAQNHSDIMDAAFSAFWYCPGYCDIVKIKEEYAIADHNFPREDGYNYKYAMDLDGNSFSGRFLGLLGSGSLVFKSTIFTEHLIPSYLKANEHYIPVLPDLSDLAEKVEWANTHDAEARMIQAAGKAMMERVLIDKQHDCYWYLLLLELARLQGPVS